ncbi:MAG: hypothetical protein EBT39_04120 [Sphingobacteriia bacterium]|jgi:Tol biopolymer transport system component|nr:hypothetical protein [Candidatus Fonsibacter lacus]
MNLKRKFLLSWLTILVFGIFFWASTPSRKTTYVPPKKAATDLLPAVTPDAKELTRITNSPYRDFGASISPDSKKILYYSENPDQTGTEGFHIYLQTIGEPGTSPLLTNGCLTPAWTSDGTGFYFKYAVAKTPIIAKSKIAGGGISYVSPSNNGENDGYPTFFNAANKIIFETSIGKSTQVATIEPNGLNFTILVTGAKPHPHPSENRFVYESEVGANWQIFTYDNIKGQQTQLTSDNYQNSFPRYSPDGKWIVYRKRINENVAHIFIMSSSGGKVKQLTTGNTWNVSPEYGLDGYIYFSSNAGNSDPYRRWDNFDIWRLKPNLSE